MGGGSSPGERGLFVVQIALGLVVAICAASWAHDLFRNLLRSLGAH